MSYGSVSRESLGQKDLELLNNISIAINVSCSGRQCFISKSMHRLKSHKLLHAAPSVLLNIFPPPVALLNIHGKYAKNGIHHVYVELSLPLLY